MIITNNQLTVNGVICCVVFLSNNTANSLLMDFDNCCTKNVLRLNGDWLEGPQRSVNYFYITTHSQTPIFCIVSRVDKRYI